MTELERFLNEIGVVVEDDSPKQPKARCLVATGWKPSFKGQEPPF